MIKNELTWEHGRRFYHLFLIRSNTFFLHVILVRYVCLSRQTKHVDNYLIWFLWYVIPTCLVGLKMQNSNSLTRNVFFVFLHANSPPKYVFFLSKNTNHRTSIKPHKPQSSGIKDRFSTSEFTSSPLGDFPASFLLRKYVIFVPATNFQNWKASKTLDVVIN